MIPSRATAGWNYGTDNYSPFFKATITTAVPAWRRPPRSRRECKHSVDASTDEIASELQEALKSEGDTGTPDATSA